MARQVYLAKMEADPRTDELPPPQPRQVGTPTFIPLRAHTAYSILEGMLSAKDWLKLAHKHNLPAIGLADTGHLFGAMEFSLTLHQQGIQPLIGCQLTGILDIIPEASSVIGPLVLFAQTEEGYRNLCRLVTDTTVGSADRNHMRWSHLSGLTKGLLALTGGPQGVINQLLHQNNTPRAEQALRHLMTLFPDRLYVEISRDKGPHPHEYHLVEMADRLHLPLIATQEVMFEKPEDFAAYEVLRCVEGGFTLDDDNRPRLPEARFFRTPQEMADLFKDLPDALANSVSFAQRCHFYLTSTPAQIPTFCPDAPTVMRNEALAGLADRPVPPAHHEEYHQRLMYECDMITRMGFANYFLIVSDFIRWAKSQHIPVGPGRGSGASSLVAWALKITDVDPIQFDLFFERFLNPDRISPPDFDVDFCQERRDEVIRYVCQRYGLDKVSHIITFGKLQARLVLRDVGRVLGHPYGLIDKICKMIPHHPAHPVTLEQALIEEPRLAQWCQDDAAVATVIAMGRKLEGLYRHASTHAAGIVISDKPLRDRVPLYQDPDAELPATEFSLKYLDEAGLIKFDFLGLKNLTTLQKTVDLLAEKNIHLDLLKIPLDDPAAFSLMARGETVGIFQIESSGMTDVVVKLRPESFEEIIALVALYRPGPMADIPRYIACRHGRETASYPYPCLEPILKPTFGVMVYQEQVLHIAKVLAGYTLGQADLLRRAMAKKIPHELEAQRKTFIEGTLARAGGDQATASTLFDQIVRFAGYAFPKAHAAPYALISYQTAYLKAHYPVDYMIALLDGECHDTDRLAELIREVRRLRFSVRPPDVNTSEIEFRASAPRAIRYGLLAVKNVGRAVTESIVNERRRGGPYQNIFDFVERLPKLNKRAIESLIMAGAFDSLHPHRNQLLTHWPLIASQSLSDTPSLFDIEVLRPALPATPLWSWTESAEREKQALGFYLMNHPLAAYGPLLRSLGTRLSTTWAGLKEVWASGLVVNFQERKGPKPMAFLTLSDEGGMYEATIFDAKVGLWRSMLTAGQRVLLRLTSRTGDASSRRMVEEVHLLDTILHNHVRCVEVKVTPDHLETWAEELRKASVGPTTISFVIPWSDDPSVQVQARWPMPITLKVDWLTRGHVVRLQLEEGRRP